MEQVVMYCKMRSLVTPDDLADWLLQIASKNKNKF